MFLLSNKELQEKQVILFNELKLNKDINLLNKKELNYSSFFYSILLENEYKDIELIDNVFVTAYYIDNIKGDVIRIGNKINMNLYMRDILNSFLTKEYNFCKYTPIYLKDILKYNHELCTNLSEYEELIFSILKKSIDESIYSISSIRKLLEEKNNYSCSFLNRVGALVKNYITEDIMFNKSILSDIVYLGQKTESYDISLFVQKLNALLEEEKNPLPF